MRGNNDHDGASSITSFYSLNIPVASQLAIVFYLKVMDDWQTQNKSVGCIPHLPSVDMQLVEAYDELMTYDNLSLEFPSRHSKISLGILQYTYEFLSR